MDVGCFDNKHLVVGGMEYALGFIVGCLTCIGYQFKCWLVCNFVGSGW